MKLRDIMSVAAPLLAIVVLSCAQPARVAREPEPAMRADSMVAMGPGHMGMMHGMRMRMGMGMGMRSRQGMAGCPMMAGNADTANAPHAAIDTATAPGCGPTSPALLDEGRRIFSSVGNCWSCHGSDAHGTQFAPNLTDRTWLNIDGSYAAIVNLVRSGIPNPKHFPTPMPARGGAPLTADQVCAVAGYVAGLQQR